MIFPPPHHADLPTITPEPTPHQEGITPRSGLSLKLTRESLGLSAAELATYLGVALRTQQRWELLDQIPTHVEIELRKLIFITNIFTTNAEDEDTLIVHTNGWREINRRFIPEAWWRCIVGHAVQQNTHIEVILEDN